MTSSIDMVCIACFISTIISAGHVRQPSCQNDWKMWSSFCFKNRKKTDFCSTGRKKMSVLGHFCPPDPHIWNQNMKSFGCETSDHNAISTRQGWRLFPGLTFVAGPLHWCFFIIFGIVTFAARRNFTNFLLSSACCNPRGRLVLLFALSKHVLGKLHSLCKPRHLRTAKNTTCSDKIS